MNQVKDQTPSLPKDLGGYQQVLFGKVQPGDIIRNAGYPYDGQNAYIAGYLGEDDLWVERDIEENTKGGYVIYRKMACPQHGGAERETFFDAVAEVDNTLERMEELKKENAAKAKTYDDGKPPLANLPWEGIKAVSRVQAYGHKKYKDYNNYRKGMEVSRNLSCAIRHIAAYMEGESNDPESKESHLAHAACRLLFVLQNEADGCAIDDRFKK